MQAQQAYHSCLIVSDATKSDLVHHIEAASRCLQLIECSADPVTMVSAFAGFFLYGTILKSTLVKIRQSPLARPLTGFQAWKYRGVRYSIIRGKTPNVWRWSVIVGQPEMLRIAEAPTEHEAEAQVHQVIDRALNVQEALRFLNLRSDR